VNLPVVTVDGPSGAGKGTISHLLARDLGWHLLDSGALYRVTAQACLQQGVDWLNEIAVAAVARRLDVGFMLDARGEVHVMLDGTDVTRAIRTEEGGRGASTVAALPAVLAALLERQREFLRPPGLVADGRDMGTAVFPAAPVKIFLTASAEERARRRYAQLLQKGENVSLPRLLQDIQERDARDSERSVSPLRPAADALLIDSTAIPIDAVYAQVLGAVTRAGLVARC
jgi:CMP/dCMP kinase